MPASSASARAPAPRRRERGDDEPSHDGILGETCDASADRRLKHQLGDDVRVENDHSANSAARAGVPRVRTTRSIPPTAPKRFRNVVKSSWPGAIATSKHVLTRAL